MALLTGVGKLLMTGFCAWIVCLPLLAVTYHMVSPMGLLVTVAAIPLVAVGLFTGFAMMVLASSGAPLVQTFAWVCQATMQATGALVHHAAAWEGGYWYTSGPPVWWVWAFYGLLGLWLIRRRLGLRRPAMAGAVGLLLLMGLVGQACPARRPDHLRITFLDVGHGCAVLAELPNGRTVLYDVGTLGRRDVGADVVAPFLWHRRVRRLDAVVLSHAQVDHMNGLFGLADRVPIARVYVSPQFADFDRASVRALAEHLRRRGIPMTFVWQGDRLGGLGQVQAQVLHPSATAAYPEINDRSVALMLRYGRARVLLAGDLETQGQHDLMHACPTPVDVLLAPHHGSRASNTWDFIGRVRPRLAVISTGWRPPRASTMANYRQAGTVVRQTRRHGAVTVIVQPDQIEVTSFLQPGERKVLGL